MRDQPWHGSHDRPSCGSWHLHVGVAISHDLSKAESASVVNGGVVLPVIEDIIILTANGRDDGQVGLVLQLLLVVWVLAVYLDVVTSKWMKLIKSSNLLVRHSKKEM